MQTQSTNLRNLRGCLELFSRFNSELHPDFSLEPVKLNNALCEAAADGIPKLNPLLIRLELKLFGEQDGTCLKLENALMPSLCFILEDPGGNKVL